MANIINQYGQVKLGVRSTIAYPTDSDAQAFITAAAITDSTQQSAIITLVTQLKTYGIWSKMKALYPFVGGTAAQHKFNLKDPRDLDGAYRIIFNGGMTHSALGIVSNYTTSFADTRLIPSTALSSLFSQHVSVYSQTSTASPTNNTNSIGEYQDGTRAMLMKIRNLSNVFSWEVGNGGASTSNTDGTGFYLGSVVANNSVKLYKNNTNVATNTATFTGSLPTQMQPIGKNENKTFSFASIGDGLTDTEAANLYTAVQTFQGTLGRQVVSDSDAQAFITAAAITGTTQQSAINTLVTNLKTAGIWTKMKAIYPMVGGTPAQHRFNLKDPRTVTAAYYIDFMGGGTHSATGYKGNQSTAYADTKFTGLSNNSCLAYYNRYTALDNTNVLMGVYNNPDVNSYISSNLNGISNFAIRSLTSKVSYASTANAGLWMANRQSQTNFNAWHNGVKKGTDIISSSTSTQSGALFLNAYNSGAANYLSQAECAFASISDGLTDTEATAFYIAVQAYQTTLSRAV